MKKFLIPILIIISFYAGNNFTTAAYAQKVQNGYLTDQISLNPEIKQLNIWMQDFLKASNHHNIDEEENFYSQNFISGDGLKKDDIVALIKNTWKNYPDLKYASEIKDIRVSNNLAAIESYDSVTGNSAAKSDIANDTGAITSNAHSVLYLQKFGKDWKLVSDKVFYEKTVIKYGNAKKLNISLNSPEQVYSGDKYTASLYTDIPTGMFAFGSITREPVVYPAIKPKEVFRQVSIDTGILERLMQANTTNNNELAVASIGYIELGEDINANPDVKFTGMAILLQRINVIPKSTFVVKATKPENLDPELDEIIAPPQPDTDDDKNK